MNEEVLRYTYDFQQKYTGIYEYASYLLDDVTETDFARYLPIFKTVLYHLKIDEDGFLLFEQEDKNGIELHKWNFKILDETNPFTLFKDSPSYLDHGIYFINNEIVVKQNLYDLDDWRYQLVYKKQQ